MSQCAVRVLGRVDVRCAGPRGLPAQQAKVLSMLVAAGPGRGVQRSEIVAAVWPAGVLSELVSPVISRLRGTLGDQGLVISQARAGEYRLESGTARLQDAVDVFAFKTAAARAHELVPERPRDALVAFREAAACWGGEPFASLADWALPRVCADAEQRWSRRRTHLAQEWARTVLRVGDLSTDRLVEITGLGGDVDGDDALWLLDYLVALQSGRRTAAEAMLDGHRARHGHTPLSARAFELMGLHEAGIDVGARALPPVGTTPLRPAQVDAFAAALRDRGGPWWSMSGPFGGGKSAALAQLAARAQADGARVAWATGHVGHPWATVVGAVWAQVLRDLAVPHEGFVGPRAAMLGDLVAGRPAPVKELVEPVAALLRQAGTGRGLLVAIDDLDAADAPAHELTAALGPALVHTGVGVAIAYRSRTGPLQVITERRSEQSLLEWLAVADATADPLRRIDIGLVAEILGHDSVRSEQLLADAAAAGAVQWEDGPRLTAGAQVERAVTALRADPRRFRAIHLRAYTVRRSGADALGVATHALAARGLLPDNDVAAACLRAAQTPPPDGVGLHGTEQRRGFAEQGLALATDKGLRHELHLTLGDVRFAEGDLAGAERAYRAARDDAVDDPVRRAEALLRLVRRWSAPGHLDTELVAFLEADLAALDGVPAPALLRLRLQASLACKLTMAVVDHAGDERSAARHREGVALARATLAELETVPAPGAEVAEALLTCRWALFDVAAPQESLAIAERWERIGAGVSGNRGEGVIAVAVDRLRLGRVRAARAAIEQHRVIAEADATPLSTWLQLTCDTVLDFWHGHFAQAQERLFGEARAAMVAAAGAPHADTLAQTWTGQVFWLHRELGRFPLLIEQGGLAPVERRGYFPIWVAGMTLALAEVGRSAEAVDQMEALVTETSGLKGLPPHGWSVPTLVLLAETCAAVDAAGFTDRDLTPLLDRLTTLLRPHADEFALAGWPTVLVTPVRRSLGLLRLASGDPEGAIAEFDAIAPLGGARPQLARLRYDLGRGWLRAGASVTAAPLLTNARDMAAELGMTLLASSAERLIP